MKSYWERWFELHTEQRLLIIAEYFDKIDKQKIELEILREYFKIKAYIAEGQ